MPAPRPATVACPLRPERAARRKLLRDVAEHGLSRLNVVVVADATAVTGERVRIGDAADPRDMHVVALVAAVERARLDQARRVRLVVPAVEAPGRELAGLLDRDPGRIVERRCRPRRPVGDLDRELDALARLPAIGLHVRRRGRLRAVVAKWLLAVGEVEPHDRAPFAVGEADAGLAEGADLARDEPAAAREHGRRRASVGAEGPRAGLHPLDVDVSRREAGKETRAALGPALAVEDTRDEPPRVVGVGELE